MDRSQVNSTVSLDNLKARAVFRLLLQFIIACDVPRNTNVYSFVITVHCTTCITTYVITISLTKMK